jgi:hypothetical protein
MSAATENGKKALDGKWMFVKADRFTIIETMTMTFEGESCYVEDGEGDNVISLVDVKAERTVYPGYQCHVMKAHIKFDPISTR